MAERVSGRFSDGAFFVALQDARDRTTVAVTIASALGIRERPDRDLERGLKDHLRDREHLLVLDNFEQALNATPLVADLLAGSPRLRVIVTSRAVLHLSGELAYEVPALRVPDTPGLLSLDDVATYDAVALFVERARASDRSFLAGADNLREIVEICRRLDGLPLAIELAAARTRLLTPAAILDRLDRHLPVLAVGATDLPQRQRTLDAAIEWSYDLLLADERSLFERLSVFAGGWTVEAAQAVCDPDRQLGLDTFEGLVSLADKSLVRPMPASGGETRFDMLQVLREFALERLATQPEATVFHRRHAATMMRLAEATEPELRLSQLRSWQHRLRREQENLRIAFRWALDAGETEIGLRTAGAIWDYWHYWAELREGIRWLEDLLALDRSRAPSLPRAKAMRAMAGLLYWQGDADRAFTLYDGSLAIARVLGDDRSRRRHPARQCLGGRCAR